MGRVEWRDCLRCASDMILITVPTGMILITAVTMIQKTDMILIMVPTSMILITVPTGMILITAMKTVTMMTLTSWRPSWRTDTLSSVSVLHPAFSPSTNT